MAVAILSRAAVTRWPFHEWLADTGEELHLFTVVPPTDPPPPDLREALARYASVRFYREMKRNVRPELDIIDLAAGRTLNGLVCLVEWDMERAGALRDRLAIPGQGLASALAYRNKVTMKDALRAAGVPVTSYRRVHTILDVVDHIRDHGYPVVVKPCASGGAMGVHVVEGRADLDALADQGLAERVEVQADLVVEGFVPGQEYIVDGFVNDGRIVYAWPSCYLGTPTDFTGAARHLAAVMLDIDHPLRARLQEMTARVVRALPSPSCFPFHAEFYHTPDDRLVAGEIGCRAGGGRIDSMCHRVFGISPNRAMARHQAGHDPEVPDLDDVDHVREVGLGSWVTFWGRPGIATRLPDAPREPWVLDWRLDARVGEPVKPATHSGDFFGSAVVTGRSFAEIAQRIEALGDWFWSSVEIAPAGELAPA